MLVEFQVSLHVMCDSGGHFILADSLSQRGSYSPTAFLLSPLGGDSCCWAGSELLPPAALLATQVLRARCSRRRPGGEATLRPPASCTSGHLLATPCDRQRRGASLFDSCHLLISWQGVDIRLQSPAVAALPPVPCGKLGEPEAAICSQILQCTGAGHFMGHFIRAGHIT